MSGSKGKSDPVVVQLLITDPPRKLRQLVEPIGSERMTAFSIGDKPGAKALLPLLDEDAKFTVPNGDVNILPRLDEVGLAGDVLIKMLAILPPSSRPERDKGFLIELLTKIEVLALGTDQLNPPDSIKQLSLHIDDHGPLNALSFCLMVEDDSSFAWIKQNTQLRIGRASQQRLKELARVLRGVYLPVPEPEEVESAA